MPTYIYELPGWPCFKWNEGQLSASLGSVRHKQGRLIGRMQSLGFNLRSEATLTSLTSEVIKSSEIEGESLNHLQVRSSIASRLGIDIGALAPADRRVDAVVEMILDATVNFNDPITPDRLFRWHKGLFPDGLSGMSRITVGAWRKDIDGPMLVISGALGRERLHYQAPPADQIDSEMERFLQWYNSETHEDLVIKAALAHLWFVTVHPFDDGNGRIARAITDNALTRSEFGAPRFYSMSSQIRQRRNDYYDILEATQKGELDITAWLMWFLDCLEDAIDGAETALGAILAKARFWEQHSQDPFNSRQRLVMNRILDGFEGKLTSSKYAKLAKCSQDTALRDIEGLIKHGALKKDPPGGRSTSYSIADRRLTPRR